MCSSAKDPHYYTGSGELLSKSVFLESLSADCHDKCSQAAAGPTVVLLGENHSDPAAHAIELDLLKVIRNLLFNLHSAFDKFVEVFKRLSFVKHCKIESFC